MSTGQGTGLLSIGEVSRLTNTHPNTIRKYTENGSLPTYRIGKGMRRFLHSDVMEFWGICKKKKNNNGGQIVIIARVSDARRSVAFTKNNGTESDLSRQVARLRSYALEIYNEENPLVFADTGSGLNFERKQFNILIDKLLNREIQNATILATRPERILRIGRPLFEKIVRWANCKIIYTEQDDMFENEEAESPMQIITEFMASQIAKIYIRRSSERNKRRISPQIVERLRAWREEGISINQIVKLAKSEGFKCDNGGPISYKVAQRVLLLESPTLEQNRETSTDRFIAENVKRGASGLRLRKCECYDQYLRFARENNLPILSASMLGRKLVSIGIRSTTIPDKKTGNKKVWSGIYLVGNEKLSILVREAPKKSLPTIPHENSFFVFFQTVLAGHVWRGSDILARYKVFCGERGLRRETRPKVVRMLADLGFTSEAAKTGFIYDLRAAEKVADLGLPLREMLAPSAISR